MSIEWGMIDMTTCIPIFGRAHKSRHDVRREERSRGCICPLGLSAISGRCKAWRRYDGVVVGQQTATG